MKPNKIYYLPVKVITNYGGYAWYAALPNEIPLGDTEDNPRRSSLHLFEDGLPLGPAHSFHEDVRSIGFGRYSHWNGDICFSSSDNSSPAENGRRYEIQIFTYENLLPLSQQDDFSFKKKKIFYVSHSDISHKKEFAWSIALPPKFPPGDDEGAPFFSKLKFFENGMELGPAHAIHSDIERHGEGRYSHYKHQLFFSSSDNTSPLENGRSYQILLSLDALGGELDCNEEDIETLPELVRFNLARDAYKRIWKNSRLPDIGRHIDSDKEFERLFHQVSPEAEYSYERKWDLDQLFKLAKDINGDVAECGTYKGASAFFLGRHIVLGGLSKRLCLFDSFEGLSQPDADDGHWWQLGDLSASTGDVLKTLAPLGDCSFVDLFPGWIPDRFQEVADRRFCFVHIDVDLAQPTLECLRFFYPRMFPGGLIVFDDYGHASCPGVTSVVDEFMAQRPEPVVNLASGGAFILKKGNA